MKRAFTLKELLIVISIIALLIGILLPSLGAARRGDESVDSAVMGALFNGPLHYPYAALTRAEFNWQHLFNATLGVCVMTFLLHRFCKWIRWAVSTPNKPEDRVWKWRWTLTLVAVWPLLFLLCLTPVAIMEHTRWLYLNERPTRTLVHRMAGMNVAQAFEWFTELTALGWNSGYWNDEPFVPAVPMLTPKTNASWLEQIHFIPIRRPDRSLYAVVLSPRDEIDRSALGLRVIKGEKSVTDRPATDWPHIIDELGAEARTAPRVTETQGAK